MILFNGQEFPSMKAFKRAYPVYAAYAEDVRDGADTVLKLEALRHKRRHLPPKQKPADFTFTRKGAGQ